MTNEYNSSDIHAAMSKRRLKLSTKTKGLLLNKSMDLLLIIVGVTIAFQLNNVKEHSEENILENFYLESLVADIDKDIASFQHILQDLRSDSAVTVYCLSVQNPDEFTTSLSQSVQNILSFETFNYRNDNTYLTLINSHGLSMISDRNTRNLISEYYKCYNSINRLEYVYTEFLLHDFHPYFAPVIDYETGSISDPVLMGKNVETRNQLRIAAGQLDDGIETYSHALSTAYELRKSLINNMK